ncbi:hypothetical protein CSA37_08400 [Candidatus Fermentibacteria bacterium]|nr:MAG: hypothetical protein CSA37_08400 [Candidatus Fermentibacteria bacterium]
MKPVIFLLLLLTAAAVSESGYVTVPNVTRNDLEFFSSNGFIIDAVFGSKARLYTDEVQNTQLRNMGYRVFESDAVGTDVPYPSYAEIVTAMNDVVSAHPGIAKIEPYGTSEQGRTLYVVTVSDNVNQDEAEPEIRIHGGIHGDEKSSTMSVLNFLEVLTDNYGTSDMCNYVVDNAELSIITVINPDGYAAHSRTNANGVDLNRDFSYMNPSSYWQGSESVALRNLTMQNWPDQNNYINPYATGLSFHSGSECVNSVWNYSASAVIQDIDLINAQATAYAQHPSITAYYGSWDIWVPGASWYPTEGDVNDWSYGECGTVDYTIEVSDIKSPEDWPGVANANYMPILEFCTTSTYGIYGTVLDGSGNPLDALIEVEQVTDSDSSPLRFCHSDVIDGGYSKALLPGTYNVVATVAGHGSLSQNNITVGSEEMVPVNFVFTTGIGEECYQDIFLKVSVSPNPVAGSCLVTLPDTGVEGTLEIYDISGRAVYRKAVSAGTGSYSLNAGGMLPAGVYNVVFTSGRFSASSRMVVAN